MTKEDKKYFEEKFSAIDDKFREEREYFDKRFEEIENRLVKLEEWTKIADKKFDLIEQKFVEVDQRLEKLEIEFEQVREYMKIQFSNIQIDFNRFDRRIENIWNELSPTIENVRKMVEINTIRIGQMETGYNFKNK